MNMESNYHVPFDRFVSLLESISTIPRRLGSSSKTGGPSRAVQFLNKWVAALRDEPLPPGTMTTFLRLLFPEADSGRRYGLQEATLARCLANVLSVSTAPGGRGRNLLDWKAEENFGCLGNEVRSIMESTSDLKESNLTMSEVDSLLMELASSCAYTDANIRSSVHHARPKRAIIQALYSNLCPISAGFLTQIILRDLRPLLYPLDETHYSASLLQYNSMSVTMITKEDAMRAWDPSGRMLKAYRLKASFDAAAEALDKPGIELIPQIGYPITIPKCLKGQGCAQSLKILRGSSKVWVETKYDGERAQIHVEITYEKNLESKITIFSKSKRDSTLDRIALHPIIRETLGLLPPNEDLNIAGPSTRKSYLPKFKKNIVLEAEMVAFSNVLDRIDEFWRIRSLVASTAYGVRHATPAPLDSQEEVPLSQSSMISNASDGDSRHLALVFFDVLMIDSVSLLTKTYAERRAVLESTIITRHGYSMLAERRSIPMGHGVDECSVELLERIFAKLISGHEEGAVLKADEGRYCDWSLPWVKLKKDYIPGYGDTVDLALIGATWDKDRARELGVAPTVYTTFYIGALANTEQLQKSQCDAQVLPHFEVLFTCAYLPSRAMLEELNFMIRSSDLIEYDKKDSQSNKELTYTFNMYSGLQAPKVLLRHPLLVEVYGAGFTKAPQCRYYEIRFPRISKVFRPSERSACRSGDGGGTTLQKLQVLARESAGKDRPGKQQVDWCKSIWGKSATLSPGVRSDLKRKQREDDWVEKLRAVDVKVLGRQDSTRRRPDTESKSKGRNKNAENDSAPQQGRLIAKPKPLPSLRPMDSMTNLSAEMSTPTKLRTLVEEDDVHSPDLPPSPRSTPLKERSTSSRQSSHAATLSVENVLRGDSSPPRPLAAPMYTTGVGIFQLSANVLQKENTVPDLTASINRLASTSMKIHPIIPPSSHDVLSNCGATFLVESSLAMFLKDAVIWLARPSDTLRPSWRAASHQVLPKGQQVHTIDSFLTACGWTSEQQPSVACEWASKGVIFVDDKDGKKDWIHFPFSHLAEKRQEHLHGYRTNSSDLKPVFIFSIKMLSHDVLEANMSDIGSYAICRLG